MPRRPPRHDPHANHAKTPIHRPRKTNPTGRDADPRRTIPLNTAAWQKLRASVLAEDPLCRDCERMGRVTPATDVDHDDGNPGNNDRANLVPRCHSCHSHKTMRERHGNAAVQGCDLNGMPLDPNHPWNRQKSLEADRARPAAQSLFNADCISQYEND